MSALYSFQYAIPYCLLIIGLIGIYLLQISNKLSKRNAINISGFILVIFIGLRGHVQSDFIAYYPYFQSLPTIWSPKFYSYHNAFFEPGFILYSSILKSIIPNYFCWVFINTLIDITILTWVFNKYSKSVVLSWIFFLIFNGLVIEFNLFRNAKAICLFLLSIQYIEQRKFFPFFILWLLAMTFHTSALLYLPMYFIIDKKYNRQIIFTLFIVSNIIFFFKLSPTSYLLGKLTSNISFLPNLTRATGYFENNSIEMGFTLGYFERTFFFLMSLLFYKKLIQTESTNRIFCNTFFIYYIAFYLFSDVKVFVERIPILFTFAYWIVGPNLIYLVKVTQRKLVVTFFFIFALIKIYSVTHQLPYNYDNLLFGIEDYQTKKSRYLQFNRSR